MKIKDNNFFQTIEDGEVETKYNSLGLGTVYNPDTNTLVSNLTFPNALLAVQRGNFKTLKSNTNLLNELGQFNKNNLDSLIF